MATLNSLLTNCVIGDLMSDLWLLVANVRRRRHPAVAAIWCRIRGFVGRDGGIGGGGGCDGEEEEDEDEEEEEEFI